MELQKVLFIEDNDDFADKLCRQFTQNNVQVIHIRDDSELDSTLTNHSGIQLVILDWLIASESSEIARLCLQRIHDICFLPVIVWTEELGIFEGEAEDVYKIFPKACIKSFSKNDITQEQLVKYLIDWYSTPPMIFMEHIRKGISVAVERTFYKLAEYSSDDIVIGLKSLINVGADVNDIDIEHTIDVLLRLIERSIYLDDDLIVALKRIISGLQTQHVVTKKGSKSSSRLQDLYMYYEPRGDDLVVRNGDIVEVCYSNSKKDRAVVITPACDLANPGKTQFLTLEIIHEDNEGKQKFDRWSFMEDGHPMAVFHHELLVLKNITLSPVQEKPSVMLYSHDFMSITEDKVVIRRQKRFDDPYRSDLLHHFVSYSGRIGVPGFKPLSE